MTGWQPFLCFCLYATMVKENIIAIYLYSEIIWRLSCGFLLQQWVCKWLDHLWSTWYFFCWTEKTIASSYGEPNQGGANSVALMLWLICSFYLVAWDGMQLKFGILETVLASDSSWTNCKEYTTSSTWATHPREVSPFGVIKFRHPKPLLWSWIHNLAWAFAFFLICFWA